MASVEERLAALESKTIDVNDLPLAQLQRALALRWTVNPNDILQRSSIDSTLLADAGISQSKLAPDALNAFLKLATVADRKFAFGTQAITWAASAGAAATITHGLGSTPAWFSLGLLLAGQVAYLQATALSSTTISVNGQAAGAWSGSGTIYWAAIA